MRYLKSIYHLRPARSLLAFVSTLTYSLSSPIPFPCPELADPCPRPCPGCAIPPNPVPNPGASGSFLTAIYASPKICNAIALNNTLSLPAPTSNNLSQTSLNTLSTSNLVPLNNAWTPFSAACSSSFFLSSGESPPAFSAAWIWSNTALSSIAERRVDTVSEKTWYLDWTLCIHPPTPKKVWWVARKCLALEA